MSLVGAWILFPLVVVALSLGCGLLLERVCATRLPGALVPGAGMAVIVVASQFATLTDATAELAVPLVVVMAVSGFGLGLPRRTPPIDRWAVGAGAAAFAAFAAPIVLSGDATFAGYIKLDDTATWMALTDRLMEHGRNLDGLPPSTYEATLAFNLGAGYPIGAFVPLGIGSMLSGQDVAWVIQPYMALFAGLLALALWELAAPLIRSRPLRFLVCALAAQPALLFGYYLWGGVKEVAAATLIATIAGLVPWALRQRLGRGALLALAVPCAALIGVLSPGGALWLVPPLLALLVLGARRLGLPAVLLRAGAVAALVAALNVPLIASGRLLPPTSSPLTSDTAQGNLLGPLDPLQVAGVWLAGDFRLEPSDRASTYMLIAALAFAAAIGLYLAWRRRAVGLLIYVPGTVAACLVIALLGSPWVDGKALATASAALPLAGAVGAACLYQGGRRIEGGLLLAAIAGGILASNGLAYRDVNLAPRDQLAELEEIGERISGEGPTLVTEYQPYGARHFLRDADPEAVSELRRRTIPLLGGGVVTKGENADTDQLQPAGLLAYRTLVVRRSRSTAGRRRRTGSPGPATTTRSGSAAPVPHPCPPRVCRLATRSRPRPRRGAIEFSSSRSGRSRPARCSPRSVRPSSWYRCRRRGSRGSGTTNAIRLIPSLVPPESSPRESSSRPPPPTRCGSADR